MDRLTASGILLVAGFVLVLFASFASPPRLYQESDSQIRLEIVKNNKTRWLLSNIFFIIAGVTSAIGLLLFTLQVGGEANSFLNWLAVVTYALGTFLWIIFLYNRHVDPAQLFEDYSFSRFTVALFALLVIGHLLYGIIFIQADYPGWLGYGTVALSTIIGLIAIVLPDKFFASFPPQTFYFLTLAAGILFLRQ
jgi:hypothetical protein